MSTSKTTTTTAQITIKFIRHSHFTFSAQLKLKTLVFGIHIYTCNYAMEINRILSTRKWHSLWKNIFFLSFCYRISHVKFIKIKVWAKQIFSLPCWMLQHAWNLWIFSTENEKWCESEKNLNCLLVHKMKETKRFRLFIWAAHFSTPHIPYSPQRHIQIQFILPFYHFQLCWLRVM